MNAIRTCDAKGGSGRRFALEPVAELGPILVLGRNCSDLWVEVQPMGPGSLS